MMVNRQVAAGWLMGLTLLAGAAARPHPASAAVCNGLLEINYVAGPMPASPGDTVRVQLVIFTGSITGGALNRLTMNRIRFDLDCDVDFALGLPCTDDGMVVKYERNITSSNCKDSGGSDVTFADNSGIGNFNPNEVVFTPSAPVVLAHDTPDTAGCVLEFDVQVASLSNDSSPNDAEEVTGFKSNLSDATCDNALASSGTQSSSIPLIESTPTPTATPTSTVTPTNTSVPPTSTPTNSPPATATPTNTQPAPPTGTPTNSPTPCIGQACCPTGPGGLIPGYCHGKETNDCLAEVCSYAAPPDGVNVLHPPNTLTCKEGDPACDFGAAGDGVCTFKISLCFNVSDTRFPCVSPDLVSRVHFTAPAEAHPHPGADTDNRDALEAALIGLGGTLTNTPDRSISFAGGLTTPDICSSALLINVPLHQTRLGPRRAFKAIRYRVFPNPTDRFGFDKDILRLICNP